MALFRCFVLFETKELKNDVRIELGLQGKKLEPLLCFGGFRDEFQ